MIHCMCVYVRVCMCCAVPRLLTVDCSLGFVFPHLVLFLNFVCHSPIKCLELTFAICFCLETQRKRRTNVDKLTTSLPFSAWVALCSHVVGPVSNTNGCSAFVYDRCNVQHTVLLFLDIGL